MEDKLEREIRVDEERSDKGMLKWFKGELMAVVVEREKSRDVPGPSTDKINRKIPVVIV